MSIDPSHTHRLAYSFAVTARGVRADWIHTDDSEFKRDLSWNPVWIAKAEIVADGWTAEMAIPLSQLRLPPLQCQRSDAPAKNLHHPPRARNLTIQQHIARIPPSRNDRKCRGRGRHLNHQLPHILAIHIRQHEQRKHKHCQTAHFGKRAQSGNRANEQRSARRWRTA